MLLFGPLDLPAPGLVLRTRSRDAWEPCSSAPSLLGCLNATSLAIVVSGFPGTFRPWAPVPAPLKRPEPWAFRRCSPRRSPSFRSRQHPALAVVFLGYLVSVGRRPNRRSERGGTFPLLCRCFGAGWLMATVRYFPRHRVVRCCHRAPYSEPQCPAAGVSRWLPFAAVPRPCRFKRPESSCRRFKRLNHLNHADSRLPFPGGSQPWLSLFSAILSAMTSKPFSL